MKTKSKRLSLKEAQALASDACTKLEALTKGISSEIKDKIEAQFLSDESNFIRIYDHVNLIHDGLTSMVDGRPQPLDLSGSHAPAFGTESEIKDELRRLSYWAECHERGCNEKVNIAGTDLGIDDLLTLKDWINSAIQWHQSKDRLNGDE